ncbi:hypothetical protein L798_05566 [Zootermopsis nevadensis]|uniref:Uncharacterized protein n=1 Tax=Zootermopsis nevadensis TaxID=136037 RepID=A0A067RBA1_ZOONE|nr:hypothetical protein L798_05566 [Zootermopsis nevadensis]
MASNCTCITWLYSARALFFSNAAIIKDSLSHYQKGSMYILYCNVRPEFKIGKQPGMVGYTIDVNLIYGFQHRRLRRYLRVVTQCSRVTDVSEERITTVINDFWIAFNLTTSH